MPGRQSSQLSTRRSGTRENSPVFADQGEIERKGVRGDQEVVRPDEPASLGQDGTDFGVGKVGRLLEGQCWDNLQDSLDFPTQAT